VDDSQRPLDGLRVVEIATYIAGPTGGMALAQLGADVIRVDPLGGAGDTRHPPPAPRRSLLTLSPPTLAALRERGVIGINP
jgi:crotonobetainyl-CoA:carnitine CoA-transferase CaiB-like acyl-CoA transferase